MSTLHLLPDSRLQRRPDFECKKVDWQLPDGKIVQIEVQPIFCANCGTLSAYVPKENCTFAFYLCRKCQDKPLPDGTYGVPDDEFDKAVAFEMQERFGHALTDEEILYYMERQELGTALELLAKESPYPSVRQGGI